MELLDQNYNVLEWSALCGTEAPDTILVNSNFIAIIFLVRSKPSFFHGSGFKITFSTSFDPGTLMDASEVYYLDGLRVLFQDLRELSYGE